MSCIDFLWLDYLPSIHEVIWNHLEQNRHHKASEAHLFTTPEGRDDQLQW